MKQYELATVLVKIIGLLFCVSGLVWVAGGLYSYIDPLASYMEGKVWAVHRYALSGIASHFFQFLAGVWCVLKSNFIVTKILQIPPQ